jgi:hypothetical protein
MGRGVVAVLSAAALAVACFTDRGAPGDSGAPDAADAATGPGAIFASSCALSGCHLGAGAPLGLDLSAGSWYASLVGVPAGEAAGVLRVKPGYATDTQSWLLCKVDPECSVVGEHMPFGGTLPTDQVAVLRAWVASLPPDDAGPPPGGPDTTPPVFAGASGATAGPSSITLTWSPATDDVTPTPDIVYGIYQASSPGGEDFGSPTVVTPPGATSWSIGPLQASTTFYFVVLAFDRAHNDDGHDNVEVSATTPSTVDSVAPTFAGATSAAAQSPGTVALSWSAASDDYSAAAQIHYEVYASRTSGGETFAAPDLVTLPGATSGLVTDLGGDTLYYFVVRAKDQAGNLDGNAVEVTAQTPHVGFGADVFPMFASACTSAGCHTQPNPAEGIDFSTASTARATLLGVPSTQCAGLALVEPSQPASSYLLEKLRGWGTCFIGWQMPEQQTPLSAAQIDLVAAWIGKGAPLD